MKEAILVVEDSALQRVPICRFLESTGCNVFEASCLEEAREYILVQPLSCVLLDLSLPDGNGLEFIDEIHDAQPNCSIIITTGNHDISIVVEAIRCGADNYLTKPIDLSSLLLVIKKSSAISMSRKKEGFARRLETQDHLNFGVSDKAKQIERLVDLVAGNNSTILLTGETGVGKGVLAKEIHKKSNRSKGVFVSVNCASLGGELLESELFGHKKGAFTSANSDKVGLVEVADCGTLFLDEVGDMDLAVQVQLLKLLEEKMYRRVGETVERTSDFRLICATNIDLDNAVLNKRFRQDLLYRINIFPIRIPSLRERPEDIPTIANLLIGKITDRKGLFEDEALSLLMNCEWRGNIRELRNIIERSAIIAPTNLITLDVLAEAGVKSSGSYRSDQFINTQNCNLKENEKRLIKIALSKCGGNKREAAKLLGVSRATLYRKMAEYEIDPDQF